MADWIVTFSFGVMLGLMLIQADVRNRHLKGIRVQLERIADSIEEKNA